MLNIVAGYLIYKVLYIYMMYSGVTASSMLNTSRTFFGTFIVTHAGQPRLQINVTQLAAYGYRVYTYRLQVVQLLPHVSSCTQLQFVT